MYPVKELERFSRNDKEFLFDELMVNLTHDQLIVLQLNDYPSEFMIEQIYPIIIKGFGIHDLPTDPKDSFFVPEDVFATTLLKYKEMFSLAKIYEFYKSSIADLVNELDRFSVEEIIPKVERKLQTHENLSLMKILKLLQQAFMVTLKNPFINIGSVQASLYQRMLQEQSLIGFLLVFTLTKTSDDHPLPDYLLEMVVVEGTPYLVSHILGRLKREGLLKAVDLEGLLEAVDDPNKKQALKIYIDLLHFKPSCRKLYLISKEV